MAEDGESAPGRWWPNQRLDVERLAWSSVVRAQDAAQSVASSRGLAVRIATSPELVAASFAALDHLRIDDEPAQGMAPYSGFFRTTDGWVRLHGNYPHHAAAIETALQVSDGEHLVAALFGMTSSVAVERIRSHGGIAVEVRTEGDWARQPAARATADDPWWTCVDGAERPPLPSDSRPLGGIRVLDLTRVIAGPTCSQLLACLGADVLRIDPPHRPELLDQYLSNGMGKRSAELDLDEADAAEGVQTLVAGADVVLHGYRPGSLKRYGLDPEDLARRHPALVVGALSAWGDHGPWGGRAGFDSIVQAATGIALIYASETGPGALPVQALDHATGYHLAAEVMHLLARGRGGIARISLLGAARTLLSMPVQPIADVAELRVPSVSVGSPHGRLRAVPPPLTVDGATIEAPVSAYGSATPDWLPRD